MTKPKKPKKQNDAVVVLRDAKELTDVLEAHALGVLFKHHPEASAEEMADALDMDLSFDHRLLRKP